MSPILHIKSQSSNISHIQYSEIHLCIHLFTLYPYFERLFKLGLKANYRRSVFASGAYGYFFLNGFKVTKTKLKKL